MNDDRYIGCLSSPVFLLNFFHCYDTSSAFETVADSFQVNKFNDSVWILCFLNISVKVILGSVEVR